MRISKPLLLLWAVACISIHAFSQNAINSQTTNDDDVAGRNQTLATYVVGSITKPSAGQFDNLSVKSWQTNGTGWGRSAEYRRRIGGRNYGGILFSDTPTSATLYQPRQRPYTSWSIRRYEFDILFTHEFAPVLHRVVPYVTSGAGAIALNGGLESGWDRQAALVAGAGADVRLSRLITLRGGVTMDSLKASTYSDRYYRSTNTIMVEPRIGLVWSFGYPHPQLRPSP
jgi:hypothetical protein